MPANGRWDLIRRLKVNGFVILSVDVILFYAVIFNFVPSFSMVETSYNIILV
jgi:hypothetical protein